MRFTGFLQLVVYSNSSFIRLSPLLANRWRSFADIQDSWIDMQYLILRILCRNNSSDCFQKPSSRRSFVCYELLLFIFLCLILHKEISAFSYRDLLACTNMRWYRVWKIAWLEAIPVDGIQPYLFLDEYVRIRTWTTIYIWPCCPLG
jgi:hypothetical protein